MSFDLFILLPEQSDALPAKFNELAPTYNVGFSCQLKAEPDVPDFWVLQSTSDAEDYFELNTDQFRCVCDELANELTQFSAQIHIPSRGGKHVFELAALLAQAAGGLVFNPQHPVKRRVEDFRFGVTQHMAEFGIYTPEITRLIARRGAET
jgi:hypothetical protein